MSTIAHTALAKYLGEDKFFKYGSSRVRAKLPSGHPLGNGLSGTCKWNGMVSDHVLQAILPANELAKCYAGGEVAVYPAAGDRILLEVLPSCTAIVDVCALLSEAGPQNKYLNALSAAEGEFIMDLSQTPPATAAVSICEETAPAAGDADAFPGMDLYIGRLSSPLEDVSDVSTFQAFLARADGAPATAAEVALLGMTGDTGDQWVLWAEVTADVPPNSYAVVNTTINKGARF